jgi:hypothetical protein
LPEELTPVWRLFISLDRFRRTETQIISTPAGIQTVMMPARFTFLEIDAAARRAGIEAPADFEWVATLISKMDSAYLEFRSRR